MEKCLKCGDEIPMSALREHLEVCGRFCISILNIIVTVTDKSYRSTKESAKESSKESEFMSDAVQGTSSPTVNTEMKVC